MLDQRSSSGGGRRPIVAVLVILIAGSIAWLWLGPLGNRSDGEGGVGVASAEKTPAADEDSGFFPLEVSGDSSAAAERVEMEAAPPLPKTGLAVTVRFDDGRFPPATKVVAIGDDYVQEWCNESGRAVMVVAPGSYEVLVPTGGRDDVLTLYPPEGRSSVDAIVTSGSLTEVELIVYGGAVLHCQFVNEAGQSQDVGGFSTWVLGGEEWVDAVDRRQGQDWQCRIGGLEPGTYGIAPNSWSRCWFEPQVVEVLFGETKNVTLTCEQWFDLKLDVRLRARPDGPALPIWLTASAVPLGPRILPLPERYTQFRGNAQSPNEIAIRLFPGPYRLNLYTYGSAPPYQIVSAETWSWDVGVPADGAPEWPPFECLLESVGEIAVVTGRIVGSRGREKTGYQLSYQRPDAGESHIYLHPDREDESFRLVVDLDLVKGGVIELFESRGMRRTPVESLSPSPGEQEWIVALPPR